MYGWLSRGHPGAGLLGNIFARRGHKEPTWCAEVVHRLSRRRFVSYQEIDESIIPRFAEKHAYPAQLIRQHWLHRANIPQWYGLPLPKETMFVGPFSVVPFHPNFEGWMREQGSGHRRHSCQICGAYTEGFVPGRSQWSIPQATCGNRICAQVHIWACDRWFRYSPELEVRREIPEIRGVFLLTRYLQWLANTKRPRRSARNSSTRSSA